MLEEGQAFGDGQAHQLGNVMPGHLHVPRFGLETAAVAERTAGLPAVAAGQHPVLDLVALLLAVLEERVNAMYALRTVP